MADTLKIPGSFLAGSIRLPCPARIDCVCRSVGHDGSPLRSNQRRFAEASLTEVLVLRLEANIVLKRFLVKARLQRQHAESPDDIKKRLDLLPCLLGSDGLIERYLRDEQILDGLQISSHAGAVEPYACGRRVTARRRCVLLLDEVHQLAAQVHRRGDHELIAD